MGSHWLRFVVLLLATYSTLGDHFRGGSMSWKPVGSNQIQLRYQLSFIADIPTGEILGGIPLKAIGDQIKDKSYVKCDECQEPDKKVRMIWNCTDLDDNSAYGQYTRLYTIPKTEFDITWDSCCWIDLISPLQDRSAKHWLLLAHVDVTPRGDGRGINGINQSPISASLVVEKYYKGCKYDLRIPASDPDNDEVSCRFAEASKRECSHAACGITDGVSFEPNCWIKVNTKKMRPGNHAVNVIIEDFVPSSDQPLSKVSLLFLLEVEEGEGTCEKPIIIDPSPLCKTVRPGQNFEMDIVAAPGNLNNPIMDVRTTQKPIGMTESAMEDHPSGPGRKSRTLSWIPREKDIGEPSVCYSASDFGSFTSGQFCTFIYVKNDDPLRPDQEKSTPANGASIGEGEEWTIQFNEQIRRPQSSAFIRIVLPETDEVVYQVSASSSEVEFEGTQFRFTPSRPDVLSDVFRLELDEGVAVPVKGGCGSEAAQWEVKMVWLGGTRGPLGEKSRYRCEDASLEIAVPPSVDEGAECFVHQPASATVEGGALTTSYKLCCSTSCATSGGRQPAQRPALPSEASGSQRPAPPGTQGPPGRPVRP